MDMVDLAKQNDGVKYVLVAIDIFSCFANCQPIKTKTGEDVLQALELILSGTRKPNMIRTDRGQEFRSKDVNAYLKGKNIHHFNALNTEIKAGMSTFQFDSPLFFYKFGSKHIHAYGRYGD